MGYGTRRQNCPEKFPVAAICSVPEDAAPASFTISRESPAPVKVFVRRYHSEDLKDGRALGRAAVLSGRVSVGLGVGGEDESKSELGIIAVIGEQGGTRDDYSPRRSVLEGVSIGVWYWCSKQKKPPRTVIRTWGRRA